MAKPRDRFQPRGLTLAEVVVSLSIIGLLLILGLSGLRITHSTGQSQGLANELKGLLSQARARAVVSGQPVGLVFPTSGGLTPAVSECVILSGRELGTFDRHLVFRGNYPGVGIFLGEWTVPGQMFAAPTDPPGDEGARFNIATWLPASYAQHTAFVFLPSGRILSNRAKVVGDEFCLVVAPQLGFVTNPSGATLGSANDAYTVLLSQSSTTRILKGVLGNAVAAGGSSESGWTQVSLTPPPAGPAQVPQIESVEVRPAPVDTAFAATVGAECIIEAGGVITLKVTATDVDGGPLYCLWTQADGGEFSHLAETPMEYSPEQGAWVALWHWKAPENAVPDELYGLQVQVRDDNGLATVPAGIVTNPKILVVDRGILAFNSSIPMSLIGDEVCRAYSSRFDGTDLRAVYASFSTGGFQGGLAPSRDGRRVAIGSDYGDSSIKLISMDGAEVREIVGPNEYLRPCFSPDGTKVFAATGSFTNPASWTQSVISFDSTGTALVSPSPFPGPVAGWSPDGTQALIQVGGEIQIWDTSGNLTSGNLVSTPYTPAMGAGLPGEALDWNVEGIFYANGHTEPFLGAPFGDPGMFSISKTDPSGTTHTPIGPYQAAADVGGNGRYIFHPTGQGIKRDDLQTGTSRVIMAPFDDLGRMDEIINNLTSSI